MRSTGIAILALLFAGGCVNSADRDPDEVRLQPRWEALDGNDDGVVTLDEIPQQARWAMARADFDTDGTISLPEYVSFDLDPSGAARRPLPENVRLIADLPYAGTEDPRQRVDVLVPKKPSVEGPLPVIAYVHGGGWLTGSRLMGRSQLPIHVDSGRYAAISIGYRLSWQAKWPAQIHDVKAAIRWIRAHADEYGFDPGRICAMGPSAGGHLVAELGTTNGVVSVEGTLGEYTSRSSDVQCVVDFFGPTDLTGLGDGDIDPARSLVVQLLGERPEEVPEPAREASPLHQVDASDVPFYIVHGTKDPLVDYAESVALDRALRKAGVPVIFQTIEGGGHGDFASPEIDRRVRAFLEQQFYDPSVAVPHDVIAFTPRRLGARGDD